MPLKEIRFRIKGKINGVEMTPLTMPMARLAAYLMDLATLLGHKEAVHFLKVEEGSIQAVIPIEADDEGRIVHRVKLAQRGTGPDDANTAYKKLDARLREDQGTADLIDFTKKTEIIEFPGIKLHVFQKYGPVREPGSVVGKLIRIGGLDETIPVWLKREDEEILYCEANEMVAAQLAPFYQKYIRVHGSGTWIRDDAGTWKMEKFRIQSFDPEPIPDRSITSTFEKLKAIPNGWAAVEDPLKELHELRHGGWKRNGGGKKKSKT